ncbi:protein nirH [Methyloprofundus sedimenti]|uniref:siroheme decarboxylase n=1 Tax=Methyloprofundus sedimenti TaxID=1420851 RepID=A0A1V8M2U3_9GAMM|nr:Lrp/AsnC family transcriptional regulator [Methyloprofundus sedimenti]OQK15753.1 protein nirH [Methyloprofundus sedimenti]
MDQIDRAIISASQAGLPLTPEPYQSLAEQIGISTDELMQRLIHMQEQGIIRRIGAIPNHYKLGYKHNGMTVWDIEDAYIDELGKKIGALDFVSHCYHRPRHLPDWPYNLFAMVHGKSAAAAELQIQQIADLLGDHCRAHEVLYSTRILKKTGLRIKNNVPS